MERKVKNLKVVCLIMAGLVNIIIDMTFPKRPKHKSNGVNIRLSISEYSFSSENSILLISDNCLLSINSI